jgi:hypothetical protein
MKMAVAPEVYTFPEKIIEWQRGINFLPSQHFTGITAGKIIAFPGVTLPLDVNPSDDTSGVEYSRPQQEAESRKFNACLVKLREIGIPARTVRPLASLGVSDLAGITALSMTELINTRRMGPKNIAELQGMLSKIGLAIQEG